MPSSAIKDVIAERKLKIYGSKRRVTVRIGRPFKQAKDEWRCPVEIAGLRHELGPHVSGVDSMQALQVAFQAIHYVLSHSGQAFTCWGSDEIGSGFTRSVPMILPPEYAAEVEIAMEAAIANWSWDMMARHKQAPARRKKRISAKKKERNKRS
jgi:hypothetical protein